MAGSDARYRLVRYRGCYAVAWSEGRSTRRRSLSTEDPEEARRRFADWLKAAERIGDTVRDIMEAYLAEKDATAAAPDRLRHAWARLEPEFGALRPDQVTRPLCRAYARKRRAAGVRDGTIGKELRTLRAGLRWHDPNTPAVFEIPARPRPRERYLTRDEVRRLLDACRAPHVRLFVILAVTTAGRSQAILDLTWDRIDFDSGIIRLATGEEDQSRKGRATVPMNNTARAALEAAREAALSGYVIEYGGEKVKSVRHAVDRSCERAGLDGVTPHVLRHTAAVWMAEDGVSMEEIAQYLGHEDSATTERIYARFSPAHLRKAAAALEI